MRTDHLTRVNNRFGLQHAYARYHRRGWHVSMLLVDVVRFKQINDGYGHDVGDEVLVEVARRLALVAVAHDGIVGRLGGDEFLILIPDCEKEPELTTVAGQVAEAMTAPIAVAVDSMRTRIAVTLIIGASRPDAGSSWTDQLRAADVAFYDARAHARTYAVWSPQMRAPGYRRRQGVRLRDQRPVPANGIATDQVLFDRARLAHILAFSWSTGPTSELAELVKSVGRGGEGCWRALPALIEFAVFRQVLRLPDDVVGLWAEPTVSEHGPDGGFRIMMRLSCQVTLASDQLRPQPASTELLLEQTLVAVAEASQRLLANWRWAGLTTAARAAASL